MLAEYKTNCEIYKIGLKNGFLPKHVNKILEKMGDAQTEFEKLGDEAVLQRKYGSADNAIVFAMGDGNHSLAAAKRHWEKVKKTIHAKHLAVKVFQKHR